jgi:hypothetical protein
MTVFVRRFVMALLALVSVAALAISLWSSPEIVRTEDQNHDGRPDVWRFYDRQGHLRRVEIDTNFDGRADRREYYRDGVLTRSESDRNFDNRVDLIEEFDLLGRQHVRSVVDANFDGTADLQVLFKDGQPVHSEWAAPPPVAIHATDTAIRAPARDSASDDTLTSLDDPFSADAALRASHLPRAPATIAVTVTTEMLRVPVLVADRPGVDVIGVTPASIRNPHSTALRLLPARAPPQSLLS